LNDTRRLLNLVFWTAVAVSVVHYTDNYFNYTEFPQSDGAVPDPSKASIGIAWFVLTGFGIVGYLLYRAGGQRAAAACLAVYSLSGLVGIGHYTVPGMVDEPWWRQAHVVADIALGIAVLAVAVRIAGEARELRPVSRR
jgi:hypothetical protein